MGRRKLLIACLAAAAALAIFIIGVRSGLDRGPEIIRIDTVVLLDVQGLHGGQDLYVWSDGTVVVQVVGKGRQERRYRLRWDAARIRELEELLRRHRFFSIRIRRRRPVPDEAHPDIRVRLVSGEEREVGKQGNDKHRDFDAIYTWLLARVEEAKAGQPEHVGPFDWDYVPSREKGSQNDAASRD